MIPCRDSEACDLMRTMLRVLLRSTAQMIERPFPPTCDLAIALLPEIADEMHDDEPAGPQ